MRGGWEVVGVMGVGLGRGCWAGGDASPAFPARCQAGSVSLAGTFLLISDQVIFFPTTVSCLSQPSSSPGSTAVSGNTGKAPESTPGCSWPPPGVGAGVHWLPAGRGEERRGLLTTLAQAWGISLGCSWGGGLRLSCWEVLTAVRGPIRKGRGRGIGQTCLGVAVTRCQ